MPDLPHLPFFLNALTINLPILALRPDYRALILVISGGLSLQRRSKQRIQER